MQEKQTNPGGGNLHRAQAETDSESCEQLEFYSELVQSAYLELHHERQQRQELEKELRYISQELYYMNQENQELSAALAESRRDCSNSEARAARFAAQYDRLNARFTKLEAQFNQAGTKFIEFKAHIMAWRLRNGTEAESGIASTRKDTPGTCGTVKEAHRDI